MNDAKIIESEISRCNFEGSDLGNIEMNRLLGISNFSNAILRNANLVGEIFYKNKKFEGCDLTDACLQGLVSIREVNLENAVRETEAFQHLGLPL